LSKDAFLGRNRKLADEIRRKRQIAPRPTSANQLMLLDLTGFDIMKIEWMREGTAEAVEKE